jgi:tripartite-type tricarboxylate transporter receptor subunit TctC
MVGFIGAINLLGSLAAQTLTTNFPIKPVRIIVPQTPGGASDALARIVGQKLSEKWGQPVVIENRPGAGGNIGMDAVAKAPGDGHTLLMSYVGSHAINPSIYSKLPFDPEADFVAVATLANVPFVAAVNASVPVNSMKGLVAYAAQRPVAFGSAGNGSVNHLLGEMFNTASGAKMQHVPYKGAAPAFTDLISGQIQVVFTSLPSKAQHIRSGTVKGLGVTGSKRAVAFKDISTISESGFPGFEDYTWVGVFAPSKTSPEIVNYLNLEIGKILRSADFQAKLAGVGFEPVGGTPKEAGDYLKVEITKWAKIIKETGVKVD